MRAGGEKGKREEESVAEAEWQRETKEGGLIVKDFGQVNNGALADFSSPAAPGVSTWVSHGFWR